jgi:hypothetical protein
MTMPERIWSAHTVGPDDTYMMWPYRPVCDATEYVRTDLYKEAMDRIEELELDKRYLREGINDARR